MREIIFNFAMRLMITAVLSVLNPENTALQEQFIEKAVEAGEVPDFEKAYNFYGYAFWEGSESAKCEMENILKSERDKDLYNFKFDKMCPTSKDNVKSNHIGILNGNIIKDGGKIKQEDLKKSKYRI